MRASLLLALAAITISLASFATERKPPPWEKPLAKGRDLYRENCIVCHDIDKAETKKIGPSMFRLFQNEKLPFSGGTPSEEYVNFKIQLGGDVMPAFTGRLTSRQIDLIVDYIKSAK